MHKSAQSLRLSFPFLITNRFLWPEKFRHILILFLRFYFCCRVYILVIHNARIIRLLIPGIRFSQLHIFTSINFGLIFEWWSLICYVNTSQIWSFVYHSTQFRWHSCILSFCSAKSRHIDSFWTSCTSTLYVYRRCLKRALLHAFRTPPAQIINLTSKVCAAISFFKVF